MNERPFNDKSVEPAEKKLKEVLGGVFEYFLDLNVLTKNFKHSWNYSKSSGWMEKVEDKTKALYYLIPLENSFIISMAIRDSERKSILSDIENESYKEIVSSAKKYSEGYHIKFEITEKQSYSLAKQFLSIIISQR